MGTLSPPFSFPPSSPFLFFYSFLVLPLPLEVGPLNPARGSGGAVSFEVEFGAFYP